MRIVFEHVLLNNRDFYLYESTIEGFKFPDPLNHPILCNLYMHKTLVQFTLGV